MTLFIDCNIYLQSETPLKPRDDVACDVMSRRGQHYVPRYLCSPNLCSPVPMFHGTYVPRTYVPGYLCSPIYCKYVGCSNIGIGIPSELFDKQFRCVNGRAYIAETQTHTNARTHTHTHTHTQKIDGPFTALNVPFSDGTLPY